MLHCAALVQPCVFFQLLRFMKSCRGKAADTADVKADKSAAQDVIVHQILPLQQKLLRSFDPATVDAATGNNALHEMCSLFTLAHEDEWPIKLTELLIDRGVSLHARDKKGCTPLLLRAATSSQNASTVNGLRLLQTHGADLNAQDGKGAGVLHHLVKRQAETTLEDLIGGDGVSHLDWALRNNAGQTAADLAAVKLAQLADSGADSPEKRIHLLMMTQRAMWTKHVRPELLRCLEAALPVTDLTKLALGVAS